MLELWLRTALWFPVALLIGVIMIGSYGGIFLFPLIGLLELYVGDYLWGATYLAGAIVSFFIARWMIRKFC